MYLPNHKCNMQCNSRKSPKELRRRKFQYRWVVLQKNIMLYFEKYKCLKYPTAEFNVNLMYIFVLLIGFLKKHFKLKTSVKIRTYSYFMPWLHACSILLSIVSTYIERFRESNTQTKYKGQNSDYCMIYNIVTRASYSHFAFPIYCKSA